MSVSLYAIRKAGSEFVRVRLGASIEEEFANPAFCNWANERARAILALLGFDSIEWGEISILEAQVAIRRARSALARREGVTWGEEIQCGSPRTREDGSIELRPVRVVRGACSREYLEREIDRVVSFVSLVASKGATHIQWN